MNKLKKIIFLDTKCPCCNKRKISYYQKIRLSFLQKCRCNNCGEIIKITDWYWLFLFFELIILKGIQANGLEFILFFIIYFLKIRFISITKNVNQIKLNSKCPHCKEKIISYLQKIDLCDLKTAHICENCNGLIKLHPLYYLLVIFELIILFNIKPIIIKAFSIQNNFISYFIITIIISVVVFVQLYLVPVSKG
ncbi:MAG: hypothetical protein N4A54_01360 [Peptostreptococcaceae bacterium]|nr:hypothetical protein [Peptostreptococcaceae bacterium]